MEARLELKRFPSLLVIALALAVALLLGAALGYSLKPGVGAPAPQNHVSSNANPAGSSSSSTTVQQGSAHQ